MQVGVLSHNPALNLQDAKHTMPSNFSVRSAAICREDGQVSRDQSPDSIEKPSYLHMAISMLKIRRPLGRLIFNMGIAIPGKTVFLIETAVMMTSSNGNTFRVTGPFWGESTSHRWIPLKRAHNTELWYFFGIRLNKWLSKQSRYWWFETPWH